MAACDTSCFICFLLLSAFIFYLYVSCIICSSGLWVIVVNPISNHIRSTAGVLYRSTVPCARPWLAVHACQSRTFLRGRRFLTHLINCVPDSPYGGAGSERPVCCFQSGCVNVKRHSTKTLMKGLKDWMMDLEGFRCYSVWVFKLVSPSGLCHVYSCPPVSLIMNQEVKSTDRRSIQCTTCVSK